MMTSAQNIESTTKPASTKSITLYLPAVARLLMGLPLVVSGLNGFLNFIPPPLAPLRERVLVFAGAQMNLGCIISLISACVAQLNRNQFNR
jgi:uncharacterized membrane protein YphA (DoxX/SURF4 family)